MPVRWNDCCLQFAHMVHHHDSKFEPQIVDVKLFFLIVLLTSFIFHVFSFKSHEPQHLNTDCLKNIEVLSSSHKCSWDLWMPMTLLDLRHIMHK